MAHFILETLIASILVLILLSCIAFFVSSIIFVSNYEKCEKTFELSREHRNDSQQISVSIGLISLNILLILSLCLKVLEWLFKQQISQTWIMQQVKLLLRSSSENSIVQGDLAKKAVEMWQRSYFDESFRVANPLSLLGLCDVVFKLLSIFKALILISGLIYMLIGFVQEKFRFDLSDTECNQNQKLGISLMFIGLLVLAITFAIENTLKWICNLAVIN